MAPNMLSTQVKTFIRYLLQVGGIAFFNGDVGESFRLNAFVGSSHRVRGNIHLTPWRPGRPPEGP